MATITYPSGAGNFATLAAAAEIPAASTVLGSIELGDGIPNAETAALGVVFQFAIADSGAGFGSTALTLTFETTDDGSTWYQADVHDFTISSGLNNVTGSETDFQFRVHLEPFTFGANAVRVLASGSGSPACTIAAQARLTESYKVSSGGVGGV